MIRNSRESIVTTRKFHNVVDFFITALDTKDQSKHFDPRTSANSNIPSRHNETHILLVGLE